MQRTSNASRLCVDSVSLGRLQSPLAHLLKVRLYGRRMGVRIQVASSCGVQSSSEDKVWGMVVTEDDSSKPETIAVVMLTTIDANKTSSLRPCLQSYRCIDARWVHYIPIGYDDTSLVHLLEVRDKLKHLGKRFASVSIGGYDIAKDCFVDPVIGGVVECSIALGPMLMDAQLFASIPASRAACLRPWELNEELAISVLGAKTLRRWPCYVASRSEFEIDRSRYWVDKWKEMWDRCIAEERARW